LGEIRTAPRLGQRRRLDVLRQQLRVEEGPRAVQDEQRIILGRVLFIRHGVRRVNRSKLLVGARLVPPPVHQGKRQSRRCDKTRQRDQPPSVGHEPIQTRCFIPPHRSETSAVAPKHFHNSCKKAIS